MGNNFVHAILKIMGHKAVVTLFCLWPTFIEAFSLFIVPHLWAGVIHKPRGHLRGLAKLPFYYIKAFFVKVTMK